jgi:5-methylcytosine-specific restriction endonuclease McrA
MDFGRLFKYADLFLAAAHPRAEYMREYMKNRYHSKRKEIYDHLGGKCSRCGDTKGPFHLDHKDKRKKTMRASDLHSVNDQKFKEEVKNLQLLCEKCHRDKTKESWDYSTPKPRHGTYWMYRKHNCRCKKCTQAYKEKQKEWRENRKKKAALFVDALESIARTERHLKTTSSYLESSSS